MSLGRLVSKMAMALGVLVIVSPAIGVSAAYPPSPPSGPSMMLMVEPNPVGTGGTFQVTAMTCTKGEIVPITFDGTTVNAVCTNPHAKATFRAPTVPGLYPLRAGINGTTLRRDVRVVSSSVADSGLPRTGPDQPPLLLSIGVSVVMTGGLVVFVTRRRRSVAA